MVTDLPLSTIQSVVGARALPTGVLPSGGFPGAKYNSGIRGTEARGDARQLMRAQG